jgi:hypothetical protein
MTAELQKLLDAIKPELDKVRAVADKADDAVAELDASVIGKIVSHLPGEVGTAVQTVVEGAEALRSLIDAIDGVIDAYAAPATAPTTTGTVNLP